MNIVAIIVYAVLMPLALRYFFKKARESRAEASQKMSDNQFIVKLPMNYFVVGLVVAVIFGTSLLVFSLSINKFPDGSELAVNIVFYSVLGGFTWLGIFLALKAIKHRVIVNGDRITVYSVLAKPYSFTFDEIISVFRELSYNRLKSERITIKIITGKVFAVENAEISYERLLQKIMLKVKGDYLEGFD